MKHTVFVYGTLKRGRSNFGLLEDAEFVAEAETVNPFVLYDRGPFPAAVDSNHGNRLPIAGEVFVVNDHQLQQLDMLEGHPRFYCRKEVVVRLDNGITDTAWMYFVPVGAGKIAKIEQDCYVW